MFWIYYIQTEAFVDRQKIYSDWLIEEFYQLDTCKEMKKLLFLVLF